MVEELLSNEEINAQKQWRLAEIHAGRMLLAEHEVQKHKQQEKNLLQNITEILVERYWIVLSDTNLETNYSVEMNVNSQAQFERQLYEL
ncbi:21593_t:CDS:2, partial [Racocetra persica]